MTQRASDDMLHPTPVLDWFLEVLNELFLDGKHSSPAYQLLDMYLLAMATLDNQAIPNQVVVSFPKDLISMRQDIFRPLGLAGVSPTLFHSAIQALQLVSWVSFEQRITFCDTKAYSISMPILDWYLSRPPPHLRMLHNWCHDLAGFLHKDYIFPQDAVFPYFFEHMPFDLLGVLAPANRRHALKHCPRCNQLRLVGQQSPNSSMRAFVDTSDARVTPMSFLPTLLTHRRQLVRDIQTWLCATPPSTGSQQRTPFTWRAYLMGFWRRKFSYMIPWFWKHTRDSVLDPREDRLLVVPFADLMFVMLKAHQFAHALEVLKEARSLVVDGKGGNPFLKWRYVAAEHQSVSAIAAREEQFGLARVKEVLDEFWAFMAYVKENGLVGKGVRGRQVNS